MFTKKSLTLSLLFSIFIYLEYFELSSKLISTINSLIIFIIIFQLSKKELFTSGFLISIFWFWWIGYSFVYYDLTYLIPIILVAIGIVYGILFYLISLFNNIYYKVIYIFTISFIDPFGFNWFKLELPLIDSYIGTSKTEFLILLIISALYTKYINKYTKKTIIIYSLTIFSLFLFNKYNTNTIQEQTNIKVYQYNTNIPQDIKWKKQYRSKIIKDNFETIDKAILNNYDLIIFPETSFPLILNNQPNIMNKLLKYSDKISIVLGSLYRKENQLYNSTYLFQNNTMQIAHKVVLVPFGEAVPMPEKIKNWINDIFYNGAQDYITASNPTTFNIKGTKFRNAICYEATTDEIFKNLDTKHIIAISNNAWFTPSIQPILQKLLMKYYSNKYNVYIYNINNQ